jgi:hypothetical protein
MKILAVTLIILCAFVASVVAQQTNIETVYDAQKNLTTVRSPLMHLSDDKDKYHSLDFSLRYSYSGQVLRVPERINFDLVSVVKARKLNTDLYVVFLVDGKPIHFSSNRSAIRNPVRGRSWIGEQMIFLIPYEDFLKLAAADKLAIKLGGVTFELSPELRNSLRAFASTVNH